MNKKLTRLKKIHRKKALKIDIQNIKADQSKFQITLKNKFAMLKENTPTIEELNEIISAGMEPSLRKKPELFFSQHKQ